jgi:hypothetical protein
MRTRDYAITESDQFLELYRKVKKMLASEDQRMCCFVLSGILTTLLQEIDERRLFKRILEDIEEGME